MHVYIRTACPKISRVHTTVLKPFMVLAKFQFTSEAGACMDSHHYQLLELENQKSEVMQASRCVYHKEAA